MTTFHQWGVILNQSTSDHPKTCIRPLSKYQEDIIQPFYDHLINGGNGDTCQLFVVLVSEKLLKSFERKKNEVFIYNRFTISS